MVQQHSPLSAAPYLPRPPRPISQEEYDGFLAIGDVLIGDGSAGARPSASEEYRVWLDRALAARCDAFDTVTGLAVQLGKASADVLPTLLRRLSSESPDAFQALSTVVAGAYLSMPVIRKNIAYPGQAARPPRFDEAAEEIMSGILDPVIGRGVIYRGAGTDSSGGRPR